jgi:hypothetical protein
MERLASEARPRGAELFYIVPIILGGSPTASENIIFLNRAEHIQAVRYWNKIIDDLRNQQQSK